MKKTALGKVQITKRGFEYIEFIDRYGAKCSLQQSSLADYIQPGMSAVWLGVDVNLKGVTVNERMHIDLKQAKALVKVLNRWIKNGSFE